MSGKPASDNPEAAPQKIFSILAVFPSIRLGLVHAYNLTLSGDGTAVVSHASPFGKRLPAAVPARTVAAVPAITPALTPNRENSSKTWYFGHTLYMLCCRNNTLKVELPLLMKFISARRHNSKNFLYAIDDFGRNAFGISPKNVCLDSAHDNIPAYGLLEHWDINALAGINGRAKSSENAPDDTTFNKEGHPLCKAGRKMCPWGE